MTKNSLQVAIEEAALKFADEIVKAIGNATLDEIMALVAEEPPKKRRGRPPKKTVEAAPEPSKPVEKPKATRRGRPPKKAVEAKVEAAPVKTEAPAPEEPPKKKARKKRDWPKCSVKDCDANVYMPSGPLKMCYKHFREAGGKESPLAAAARKKKAAAKKK